MCVQTLCCELYPAVLLQFPVKRVQTLMETMKYTEDEKAWIYAEQMDASAGIVKEDTVMFEEFRAIQIFYTSTPRSTLQTLNIWFRGDLNSIYYMEYYLMTALEHHALS